MSTTKPAIASSVTVTPASLEQVDHAGLPLVEARGEEHRREIALGDLRGRVALEVKVTGGAIGLHELEAFLEELTAMRDAGRVEQARQDAEARRAEEVEELARAFSEADLAASVAGCDVGDGLLDAADAELVRDALDLRRSYREAGVRFEGCPA